MNKLKIAGIIISIVAAVAFVFLYFRKPHTLVGAILALIAGAVVVGTGRYVMQTAEQFAAEIVSNNLIKVKSGDLMNQGRHMRIDVNDYEEVTIQNGAQSVFRNDLIVARYKKDPSTLIETTEIVVIKGTAGATATDPTYTSGDILAGATQDDFPLYRVSLNGLNIEKVTPLFSTVPNLDELNTNMTEYIKNTGYRYYYNTSVNIKPNEYVQTLMDISGVTKPGYIVIPIYAGCSGSGSTMILFTGIAIDGNTCKISLRNIGTSPATVNVIVFMLRTKALD